MANYSDQYYDEVDGLFNRFRESAFRETLADPTPQDSYDIPLGPIGWVENADSETGEAKVIINSDGITILDGKIFLSDIGGSSVLTPAGFGGSWIDFLELGTYNGTFGGGTTNAITATTIVGTASTDADYEASLSDDLPYWIVETKTGTGTLQRIADTAASQGFALQWAGSDIGARIFQDIPIVPGSAHTLEVNFRSDNAVAPYEFQINGYFSYRDADHAIIGSENSTGLAYTNVTDPTGYARRLILNTLVEGAPAPANARFLRVKWEVIRNAGTIDVRISDMIAQEVSSYSLHVGLGSSSGFIVRTDASQDFNNFTINSLGVMGWGSGSAAEDVILSRTAANVLSLASSDSFRIRTSGSLMFEDDLVFTNPSSGRFLMEAAGTNDIMQINGTASTGFAAQESGDTFFRFWGGHEDGTPLIEMGDGANASDVVFKRLAAGRGIFTLGTIGFEAVLDAAAIGANQNNYNPSSGDWHKSFVLQVNPTASVALTGLDAGLPGEMHLIRNNASGAFNLTLSYESASSTATNRFRYNGGASAVIGPNGAVWIWYSGARWQVVGI